MVDLKVQYDFSNCNFKEFFFKFCVTVCTYMCGGQEGMRVLHHHCLSFEEESSLEAGVHVFLARLEDSKSH